MNRQGMSTRQARCVLASLGCGARVNRQGMNTRQARCVQTSLSKPSEEVMSGAHLYAEHAICCDVAAAIRRPRLVLLGQASPLLHERLLFQLVQLLRNLYKREKDEQ